MRIISKFHDYYDVGLTHGIDPTLVYERKTTELKRPEYANYPILNKFREKITNYSDQPYVHVMGFSYQDARTHYLNTDQIQKVETFVVGFCGNVISGVSVDNHYFYQADGLELLLPPPESWAKYGKRWRRDHQTLGERTAQFIDTKFQCSVDIFLEIKSPVFAIFQQKVIINPVLRTLEFYKAMNPVTAFQEISMFIGNFLLKKDKPQPIPDKYLISEKGFDEHSFRHPTRLKDLK